MTSKTKLALLLALSASTIAYGSTSVPCFAEDDQNLPLVLGGDEKEAPTTESADDENEDETLPAPAVIDGDDVETSNDLLLPPLEEGVVEETIVEGDEIVIDGELTEEQMLQLSNQPMFKEFTTVVGDLAPLPEEIDVEALNVPGAQLVVPSTPTIVKEALPEVTLEEATAHLDEVLEIAKVDLEALELSAKDRRSIAQLDVEIKRLCPLWIDSELNRATIGRRELNWRQRGELFTTTDPKPLDVEGSDWAMAPDAPYFFQVTTSDTGEVFYTKAGDFEQIDPMNLLSPALVREDRAYLLSLEPGKVNPTGNSARIKVKKNGQVQGTAANGIGITDVDLATVALFTFENAARLASEDGVFFTPTQYSGEPTQVRLLPGTQLGVTNGKVLPSNGKPEEIFTRIAVLCKSKKRLVEILSQPSVQ